MYSLVWAIETVEAHYRVHARAAYFTLVTLGITTRVLQLWLAKRDPRWELYKKICKVVEDHINFAGELFDTEHLFSSLVHLLAKNYEIGGSNLLQDLTDGWKLGLQVFKGTPPGRAHEKTARNLPCQPSLFPEEVPGEPGVQPSETES